MLRTYIDFHRLGINKLIKRLVLRFHKSRFVFVFNLFSWVLRKDVRVLYDKEKKVFFAKDQAANFCMYFKNRTQAYNAYRLGMKERAIDIGKVYHLSHIDFSDEDLVVDCGANVGDLTLYFKLIDTNVKYFGFEPSPDEFSCLRLNSSDGRVFNNGLWNRESQLSFYVSSDGADSSLIKPDNYSEEIEVATVRLDGLLEPGINIKLLKLEAEGAEPEVLEGALGLLERVEYISADVGFERGQSKESTFPWVANYLFANGFELVTVSHSRIVALFRNVRMTESFVKCAD